MSPIYVVISVMLAAVSSEVAAYWPPLKKAVPLAQPGDHACQQINRFSEPVVVSTAVIAHHRIYYVPCGDIIKLFTCTVRKAVYQTAYKTEIRTGYRSRRVCCPGYTLNAAMCHPCLPGTYGINCTFQCPQVCFQAKDHGTCRPKDGKCVCLPGYYGATCDEECLSGRYGPGCAAICQCPPGTTCNSMTGACSCNTGSPNVQCQKAMLLKSGGTLVTPCFSAFRLLVIALLIRLCTDRA